MKLIVVLITLISFSCRAQDEIAFEFASYQNKDLTKSNTPIVKIDHYWRMYVNGKVEVIDSDGKCTVVQIDSLLIDELKVATADGLERFRNKTKPPANHFYAGYYSFLKVGQATVCFNPYDVNEDLKEALKNIEDAIEAVVNKTSASCDLPDNLTESIQDTHSKSNLKPNASPPPQMIITED